EGQLVGARHADHPAAQHQHLHRQAPRGVAPPSVRRSVRWCRDAAACGEDGRDNSSMAKTAPMTLVPPYVGPARFDDPHGALDRVKAIYDNSVAHLRGALQAFVNGTLPSGRVRATYPFVRVHTDTVARADSRLSYGFVAGPGTYETTLTRPDLFGDYYLEQFRLLLKKHHVALEIGTSGPHIPA